MSGPLAKNIADEYDVDSRKSASILGVYVEGCFQGLLPYSPQVISAAGVAGICTINVIPIQHLSYIIRCMRTYCDLFNFPNLKKNAGQMKH